MKNIPDLVIEWSPAGSIAYDARTQSTTNDLNAFGGRSAILALGRRAVFVRHIRLPNSSRPDMEQVLKIRLPELFPVGGSELAFDFLPYDDVNESGRLCLVAAARTEDLRAARSLMESRKIDVVSVLPVACASAPIVAESGLARAAVVQPVPEGFAVDIVDEGKLLTTRIVSERADLETDICVAFTLAGIPCSPVLVAGGLLLADAERSIAGDPRKYLISHPVALNVELPEVVQQRRAKQKAAKTRQAMLLAAATLLLGAYMFVDLDEANARVAKAKSKDETVLRKLGTVQRAVEADATKVVVPESIVTRAFSAGQKLSDVTTLVGDRLPAGVWLTGVSVERGKDIQIRGVSKSSQLVTEYVNALAGEDRLRNVRLVFANDSTIDETKVVQFSVSAFPVGNLPLIETGKRGSKQ